MCGSAVTNDMVPALLGFIFKCMGEAGEDDAVMKAEQKYPG